MGTSEILTIIVLVSVLLLAGFVWFVVDISNVSVDCAYRNKMRPLSSALNQIMSDLKMMRNQQPNAAQDDINMLKKDMYGQAKHIN